MHFIPQILLPNLGCDGVWDIRKSFWARLSFSSFTIHQDLHSSGNTQQSFCFTAQIFHKIRALRSPRGRQKILESPSPAAVGYFPGQVLIFPGGCHRNGSFPSTSGKNPGVLFPRKTTNPKPVGSQHILQVVGPKTHPGLESAALISQRKLNLLYRRAGNGLKVEYLCSLVPIFSAGSRPGLRGFSWQALGCSRQDLLALERNDPEISEPAQHLQPWLQTKIGLSVFIWGDL